MSTGQFIGVDVGGTKIYAALVKANGEVVLRRKLATPSKASSEEILSAISNAIRQVLEDGGFGARDVEGIGLGVPGIVDESKGKVINAPNINLVGVSVASEIQKRYKAKVAVGNDVNMGTLGEKWLGAGREARNVVGMFMGTGLGGGIVVNGKLVTGTTGYAAEIGHMVIDLNGPKCTCGNKGCLEAYVGRWAIERDIRAAIRKGEKTVIKELAGPKPKRIKSKVLKEALKTKDGVVTRIMERVSEAMGYACISLRHLFDPDLIILGGGVIEACGEFVLPIVREIVSSDPYFPAGRGFEVAESRLGDDAVFLGAVALVQQVLGLDPFSAVPSAFIGLTDSGTVLLGGKEYDSAVCVRPDGQVRDGKKTQNLAEKPSLEPAELEWLCKQKPELLIIATGKGMKMAISREGRAFLEDSCVELKVLSLPEATELYHRSHKRKTILISIKAKKTQ